MTVARDVTLAILEAEIRRAKRIGAQFGWEFTKIDLDGPRFTVRLLSAIDQEVYVMEFICDDYKEIPPNIEFIHPDTGERGTRRCYPRDAAPDGGSIFRTTPCICHQCCRKAYGLDGGPHADWNPDIKNWMKFAGGIITVGDMILMVQTRISLEGSYQGRMEK